MSTLFASKGRIQSNSTQPEKVGHVAPDAENFHWPNSPGDVKAVAGAYSNRWSSPMISSVERARSSPQCAPARGGLATERYQIASASRLGTGWCLTRELLPVTSSETAIESTGI